MNVSGRWGIAARVLALCGLFFLEKLLLNRFVDFDQAVAAQGAGATLRLAQHLVFRFLVAFVAGTALFAYVRGVNRLALADAQMRRAPLRAGWFALHVVLLACLVPLSYYLYRDGLIALDFVTLATLLGILGAAAAATALLALAPLADWATAVRALGSSALYAAVAAAIAAAALQASQVLWAPTAAFTFRLVRLLLVPFVPHLAADSSTRILRSEHFAVEVSDECSGLEGVGLVLAFTGAWLLCFRREFVFPRALVLLPLGVLLIFVLNVIRIALLFALGHAGFAEAAIYGFHSQAGWVAFISVACSLAYIGRRSVWLTGGRLPLADPLATENPVAPYLVPMIAILGAGVLSHALAAGFELFYPLRLLAGAVALYVFRAELRALRWQPVLPGVAVGVAIFGVWLVGAHFLLAPAGYPERLQTMPAGLQGAWLGCRVIAAVTLVPLAEELAYRGFLMRRLRSAEFDRVPYDSVTLWPLALSSLAFGAAHGSMWAPAALAGLAYGWAARRLDNLTAAIWAHATTNALVAASVLLAGRWELW